MNMLTSLNQYLIHCSYHASYHTIAFLNKCTWNMVLLNISECVTDNKICTMKTVFIVFLTCKALWYRFESENPEGWQCLPRSMPSNTVVNTVIDLISKLSS